MRKSLVLSRAVTAILALVLQSTANASIVTIDFESITPGPQIAGFLSSQGISSITLLRGGSVSESPFVLAEGTGTNSTNTGFGNFLTAGNSISGARLMTLVFENELTSFSFRRIDVNGAVSIPGNWTVDAFDSGGSNLGISTGESGSGFVFPGSDATFSLVAPGGTSIKRVEFSIPANSSSYAVAPIDDLVLVPEPASFSLLALVGVMLTNRRWRRTVQNNALAPLTAINLTRED